MAALYGGAFSGSFKAVQDYQAKLLQNFQANAEANMQLAQKLMSIRSPSEFIETVSSHMRERAAAIGEQAKELSTLGQEAAKKAVEIADAAQGQLSAVRAVVPDGRERPLRNAERSIVIARPPVRRSAPAAGVAMS